MSESASSSVAAGDYASADYADEQPLSGAELDRLLADFRAWLAEAATVADLPPPTLPTVRVDWDAILGQWTALRHEVNLQTKASRALLEQNGQTLAALTARPPPEAPSADEEIKPLLHTLLDLHDALTLARREVQRLVDATTAPPAPPPLTVPLPAWARWLGLEKTVARGLQPLREWLDAHANASHGALRQKVDALFVGYLMGLQRVERAVQQTGLEPIDCVGQPFDPERMQAVEVVRDAGRVSTEVLEEVRRGYVLRGRLFRVAQVRVARP